MQQQQQWNTECYAKFGNFVPSLGNAALKLLAPQPGEHILDLGCGDGALTKLIIKSGATVTGVDSSPEMVKAARANGINAHMGNGEQLTFEHEFDAVFSNAALHWMSNYNAVATSVAASLRSRGRFVGELGGHGNIASVVTALKALVRYHNLEQGELDLWYYPTVEEYTAVLENVGFKVETMTLTARPTPILAGMRAWLKTFRNGFFRDRPGIKGTQLLDEAVGLLKPALQDTNDNWTLDYMRLRFIARLKN